jgi:prepilin-type N-terminal cleavage/methylation domain-containing protein
MKRAGFSLIEVLLTILIIGILGGMVTAKIYYSKLSAEKEACKSTGAALNAQIEFYRAQEGMWPNSMNDLLYAQQSHVKYVEQLPTCPFGDTFSFNTTSHRVNYHVH